MGQRKTLKAKDEQFVKGWRILVVSFQHFDVEMAFKMIVGFAVALAAVGADALVCRPGSSSVALASRRSPQQPIMPTSVDASSVKATCKHATLNHASRVDKNNV